MPQYWANKEVELRQYWVRKNVELTQYWANKEPGLTVVSNIWVELTQY
jgi:hypothetical protein